jgi:hypothetical protein
MEITKEKCIRIKIYIKNIWRWFFDSKFQLNIANSNKVQDFFLN